MRLRTHLVMWDGSSLSCACGSWTCRQLTSSLVWTLVRSGAHSTTCETSSSCPLAVVGGSTQKLTTQQKKQEAVQVGQVMAQYVSAAPASALKVTLDMMSKAFDDFMISKEDWDSIEAEVADDGSVTTRWCTGQGSSSGEPATPPVGANWWTANACRGRRWWYASCSTSSAGVATATTTCVAGHWQCIVTGHTTS